MKSNITSAANDRAAYQGNIVLTKHIAANTDSWQTGMNNNILVLGCSGSGKTRNHLKPNLMQCQGSYIVLDTKGVLYNEMGAYLALQGYKVDQLDFTTMGGTCGYDPLHQVRIENGKPNQQDIIAIASAICPKEARSPIPSGDLPQLIIYRAISPMCSRHCPNASGPWLRLSSYSKVAAAKSSTSLTIWQCITPIVMLHLSITGQKPPAAPKRCTQASWALSLQIYCRSDSRERSILTPTPTASTSARLDERSAPCS